MPSMSATAPSGSGAKTMTGVRKASPMIFPVKHSFRKPPAMPVKETAKDYVNLGFSLRTMRSVIHFLSKIRFVSRKIRRK